MDSRISDSFKFESYHQFLIIVGITGLAVFSTLATNYFSSGEYYSFALFFLLAIISAICSWQGLYRWKQLADLELEKMKEEVEKSRLDNEKIRQQLAQLKNPATYVGTLQGKNRPGDLLK